MYARVHNITNVGGRENYIKNKKNKEEVVGFYNTASADFWKLLAKENQEQFMRSTNFFCEGRKASEAREIILGLPPYVCDQYSAEALAHQVKTLLGVECMVAIHKKYVRNEKGERVLNNHAHILFGERTLLPEPIHYEEKRAERNYYYNEKGKQCKKSEAVKVTKKGTITQEEHTRYFSNKINFYKHGALEPLLESFANSFNFERFDVEKHFPQKHIGKGNEKEKFIKEYNELVKEMNLYFDNYDSEHPDGTSAKQIFCEKHSVPQRFMVPRTEEIREKFETFKAEIERLEPVETLLLALQNLDSEEAELKEDIEKTEFVIKTPDFVVSSVAEKYRDELESKYGFNINHQFLAYLKEKLKEVKTAIAGVLAKLNKLGIEVEKLTELRTHPEKEKEQDV